MKPWKPTVQNALIFRIGVILLGTLLADSVLARPLIQPKAWEMAAQRLTGVIASVNVKQKSLIVSQQDRQYLVRVNEKTRITLDGRAVGLEQLKPGQQAAVGFVVGADGEATDVAADITANTSR